MRIDIWSDISCPWCYITKRTFERGLAASGRTDLEIILHPYQIDGEHPAEPRPMLEWLADKYGEERARSMNKEVVAAGPGHGIAFRNETGFAANTFEAHRLLWFVGRTYGRTVQSRLEELLFAAYFTEGGNVSDPRLLMDRAVRAGADRPRIEILLASDQGADRVRGLIRGARAQGVTRVPLFVFDGVVRLCGARDDPADFVWALEDTQGNVP